MQEVGTSTSSVLLMITQVRIHKPDGHKSKAFKKFKEYKAELDKYQGKSIKSLWSDRGGEYL